MKKLTRREAQLVSAARRSAVKRSQQKQWIAVKIQGHIIMRASLWQLRMQALIQCDDPDDLEFPTPVKVGGGK